MLMYFLIGVYVFSSIGIFIKLKRYGAPLSSLFYSGLIPWAIIVLNLIYVFKKLKVEKLPFNKKIKVFSMVQIEAFKMLSVLTGLMCIELGKRKVGIIKLIKIGFLEETSKQLDKISKIINKINKYSMTEPKLILSRR